MSTTPISLVIDWGPSITMAVDDAPVPLALSVGGGVSLGGVSVGTPYPVYVGGDPYEGAYVADALFTAQVFPTNGKNMRDDFTVNAINYTEALNDSGITVTIGG